MKRMVGWNCIPFLLISILGVMRASAVTGIDGDILTVSSLTVTGPIFVSSLTVTSATVTNLAVTNLSGISVGKILQSVFATQTSNASTTSTSFVDTSLMGTITPTSATSKVFVLACGTLYHGVSASSAYATLVRGSTNLMGSEGGARIYGASTGDSLSPVCLSYMDTPAITSATTYKVQIRSSSGAATAVFGSNNALIQSIVLFEVAP
jgi:hypothetical protein